MAKIYKLRSLIYAKNDSESHFAEALGWSRQRLNKITNGNKEPDLDEIKELSDKLEVPIPDMLYLFLNSKSPNDDK